MEKRSASRFSRSEDCFDRGFGVSGGGRLGETLLGKLIPEDRIKVSFPIRVAGCAFLL